jgi:hypothetical protein
MTVCCQLLILDLNAKVVKPSDHKFLSDLVLSASVKREPYTTPRRQLCPSLPSRGDIIVDFRFVPTRLLIYIQKSRLDPSDAYLTLERRPSASLMTRGLYPALCVLGGMRPSRKYRIPPFASLKASLHPATVMHFIIASH